MSEIFNTASKLQRKILHCSSAVFAENLCWPGAGEGGAPAKATCFQLNSADPLVQNIMRKASSASLGAEEAGERRLDTQVLIKSGLLSSFIHVKK